MYLTMINTLRRRSTVALPLFYDYWRDTHVGVAARLPGIDTLYTHWVDWDEGRRWPAIDGVDAELAEPLRFQGIPEPCFASAEDLQSFGAAMDPLMRDEINIFERTIGFVSLGDNSVTLKHDGLLAPNGALPDVRFMLFLKQRLEMDSDEFRVAVRAVGANWAGSDSVTKVRLHLLEPYDDTQVFLDAGAQAVSHGLATADQYQAVFEIGFADLATQEAFHTGGDWHTISAELRSLCRALHPFRILRTYTPKLDGRLTLSGLRGAAVVDQIRALGAVNQVDPATLALFDGGTGVIETQL